MVMTMTKTLNLIYTFNFNIGEVLLQKVIIEKKIRNINLINHIKELDQIIMEFDDGSKWVCYKPYVYRAKLNERWNRCYFDKNSINNTSSNALNYIVNNGEVGKRVHYF